MEQSAVPSPQVADDVLQREMDREASEWVAQVASEPSAENIAAAKHWCDQSAQHREAFERARSLWTAIARVPEGIRRFGLSESTQPLVQNAPEGAKLLPEYRRRPAFLAAAAVVVAAVCGGWIAFTTPGDYANGDNAPRQLILEDGSRVFLDAESAIDLEFSPARRDVDLVSGAAVFEVAHDRHRPFVVHGLGVTATALGTIYGVRRDDRSVTVTVKQGVVRVDQGGGAVEVSANQQVRASFDGGLGSIAQVSAENALAWQRGRLSFDQVPLSAVVEELNRYRTGYIVIADASIAALPVSGLFRIDRADDVLETLQQALNIRVRRLTGYLVLLDRPEEARPPQD